MKSTQTQLEEYKNWKKTNVYKIFRYDIINSFIKKNNYINYLESNRNEVLNLVTVDKFLLN